MNQYRGEIAFELAGKQIVGKLGINEFATVEALTGVSLSQLARVSDDPEKAEQIFGTRFVQAAIYAMALRSDKTATLEAVGDAMGDLSRIPYYAEKVAEALSLSLTGGEKNAGASGLVAVVDPAQ